MLQVTLNFGGFYGSLHDVNIDNMIESYYDSEDINFDKINYRIIYIEYAKKYVDFINDLLDTEITFLELYSPKEYNFRTDTIEVLISRSDILRVFDYIKENDLKSDAIELIEDKTTSKPGYMAFYNYEDVFKKDNRDLLVTRLLDIICFDEENLFMDWYDRNCIYELLHSIDFEVK